MRIYLMGAALLCLPACSTMRDAGETVYGKAGIASTASQAELASDLRAEIAEGDNAVRGEAADRAEDFRAEVEAGFSEGRDAREVLTDAVTSRAEGAADDHAAGEEAEKDRKENEAPWSPSPTDVGVGAILLAGLWKAVKEWAKRRGDAAPGTDPTTGVELPA